ncbi:MAG TPA: response regulator transcription factor [Candidatus Acidoferrum sp.]|jgi:DNA-binding NarL/FixJ family response regulator|nr:response regulator transcription factor [Candidatus Acidoferrum sp.]
MPRNTKKLRIVVADDHELVHRGIRDLLQDQRGWKVVGVATDGREAVDKVKKLKPDIAILDISMPEVDGLEATRRIREEAVGTQVLVLTMHESDQMVRRVLEAGARGYVLKSDMAMQLVKAVKDVASGKTSLTPKVSEIVLEGFLKVAAEPKQPEHPKVWPTPREKEVIRLLAEGKGNKEIALALGITARTVETHRARIMMKMGFRTLTGLIHYAIREKIVPAPEF